MTTCSSLAGCLFAHELGNKYVCTRHAQPRSHVCSSKKAKPCSAAIPSSFDNNYVCPISGRVFDCVSFLNFLDDDQPADNTNDDDDEWLFDDEPTRLHVPLRRGGGGRSDSKSAAGDEVRDTLRVVFEHGATVNGLTAEDVNEHLPAYAQEITRLRGAYAKYVEPPSASVHALGVIHMMLEGYTVGGTAVIPKDDLMKRLIPNASVIEGLSKNSISRRQITAGMNYVRDVFNAALGHDKNLRKMTLVSNTTTTKTIDQALVCRSHDAVLVETKSAQQRLERLFAPNTANQPQRPHDAPTPLCWYDASE